MIMEKVIFSCTCKIWTSLVTKIKVVTLPLRFWRMRKQLDKVLGGRPKVARPNTKPTPLRPNTKPTPLRPNTKPTPQRTIEVPHCPHQIPKQETMTYPKQRPMMTYPKQTWKTYPKHHQVPANLHPKPAKHHQVPANLHLRGPKRQEPKEVKQHHPKQPQEVKPPHPKHPQEAPRGLHKNLRQNLLKRSMLLNKKIQTKKGELIRASGGGQ